MNFFHQSSLSYERKHGVNPNYLGSFLTPTCGIISASVRPIADPTSFVIMVHPNCVMTHDRNQDVKFTCQ